MQLEIPSAVTTAPQVTSSPTAVRVAVAPRDVSVDNIRTIAMLFVLIGHSITGYGMMAKWWWFVPNEPAGLPVDIAMIVLPITVLMPLCFIAGYMVGPAMVRRGARGYWINRLRHLGQPWLFCTLFVSPLLMYIWSRERGLAANGYADYLRQYFAGYAHPKVGLFTGTLNAIEEHWLWWHQLWFIPTLLLMTAAAHVLGVGAHWFSPRRAAESGGRNGGRILAGWAAGSLLAYGGLSLVLPEYKPSGFLVANVLTIFPPRHLLYLVVFLAGFHCERSGCRLAELPGSQSRWVYALLVPSFGMYMAGLSGVVSTNGNPGVASQWLLMLGVWAATWASVLAAARLSRDLQQPISLVTRLAPHSLQLYFNHYLICVGANLVLQPLPVPSLVKAALCCVMVLPVSIALASRPVVAAVGCVALQLALCLI